MLNTRILIFLILLSNSGFAQLTQNYKIDFDSTHTLRGFELDFPADWYVFPAPSGTPYSMFGIKTTANGNIDINKCSPEIRVGIKVFPNNQLEVLEIMNVTAGENNVYTHQDKDSYINILWINEINNESYNGIHYTVNLLTDCINQMNKKQKRKKKKRNTAQKQFIYFSKDNSTICLESFNGAFSEESINIILNSFDFRQ